MICYVRSSHVTDQTKTNLNMEQILAQFASWIFLHKKNSAYPHNKTQKKHTHAHNCTL